MPRFSLLFLRLENN